MNAELVALAKSHGIILPHGADYLKPEYAQDCALAFDAQPSLITVSNNGIPAYLSNMIDPDLIRVLVTPMKGAEIMGEVKKGDWLTDTVQFPIVESTGEISSYGDYNQSGSAGMNVNFVPRQSYHYQTVTQWGEKTLEKWGLAKIGYAAELNVASALTLNKFQNKTYFFGVSGLLNYGLLNDPALPAAIQPGPKAYNSQAHGPWITSGVITASANEVYTDVQSMYVDLVGRTKGTVEVDTAMKLCLSPSSSLALTATNSFNVSVADLLKKNFPNLTIQTAPEYTTTAGELVQLIVDSVDGQDVGYCAFTEKMRAHPIVVEMSAFRQKKSQGTWGAVIRMPLGFAQMLGV
jgi:hypothetical protein